MKKFKRIATFVLSMVMVFSFVVTYAFAEDDITHPTYLIQCFRSEGSVSANFHANNSVLDSYAEAGGSLNATSNCFLNARTYAENFHPQGTVWYSLFTNAGYVSIEAYCEHGTITTREHYMKCEKDDAMVYAGVRFTASSDGCLVDFVSEHKLLEGILRYEPDNTEYYYQYANSETIYFYTEDNYPNN